MADVKELTIELTLENDKLKKELKSTQKAMGNTEKAQKGLKGSLSKLKVGYIAVAAVLTGVVAAAFGKAVKLASRFEEANSKFGVVFRGVSKEANNMRKDLVKAYGVSAIEATEMLSSIQDFLVPMGIARDEASNLSGEFSKLAVDIGSFNNAPTAEVMAAIQSGLAGMSQPLRRFGIDISDTTLKQMAMNDGIKLVNGRLDRQSRAQLILKKITQDSSDALGDFARTQDSLANVMKRASAAGENVALVFGQELQRAIQPGVDAFSEFLKTETGLNKIRKAIQAIFLIGEIAFGGLKISIMSLIAPIQVIQKTLVGLFKATKAAATLEFKEAGRIIKDTVKSVGSLAEDMAETFSTTTKGIAASTKELISETNNEIEGLNDVVDENNKNRALTTMTTAQETAEFLRQLNVERLEDINMTEEEILRGRMERLELFKQANILDVESEKKFNAEKAKQKIALSKIEKKLRVEGVAQTKSALGEISTLTSSTNESLFNVGKAAAIANATMNSYEAFTKTLAKVPFPLNIPLAAGVAAAGFVQVSNIVGTKLPKKEAGGVIDNVLPAGGIGNEDGLIAVQCGESVLTRDATVSLGQETINALNRGENIAPNVTINVTTDNGQEVVETLNDYFRQFGTSQRGVAL